MKTRRTRAVSVDELLRQYECDAVKFSGDPNASYERHLLFDQVVEPDAATLRERFRRWRVPCATCWCNAG
jgi:starch phosphorylase